MAINGTVQATGEFAPSATGDTYAILDAKYLRDGFKNVETIADLDLITADRRTAGMVVGVSGGTTYYKLSASPWTYTISDWSTFSSGGGGGNGTTNYVAKWTGSTEIGDSIIYDDGTNIGIGTISPTAKLYLKGDGVGNNPTLLITNSAVSSSVSVTDNGQVLVNTTSNLSNGLSDIPLKISSVSGDSGVFINSLGGANVWPMIHLGYNDTSYARMGLGGTSFYHWITGEYEIRDNTTNRRLLYKDGSLNWLFTVDASGTQTPNARLQVNGPGLTSASYGFIVRNSGATTNAFGVRDDGAIIISNSVGIMMNYGGYLNTFVGVSVGTTTANNDGNTAVGYQTLNSLANGFQNVAIGNNAGSSLTNSGSLVAVGYNSQLNSIGGSNTSVGANSLQGNTSGVGNTALGKSAGITNTIGDNNLFLGNGADASVNNLTNAIAIGNGAIVSASNTMVLGSGVNVAIGASSASTTLDVSGVTTLRGVIKNAAGTTMVDLNSGFNLNDNAGGPVIYLGAKQLYNGGGLETLNWANRYVKNSSGVQTMAWEDCNLTDAAGALSLEWSTRRLIAPDGTGTTIVANWNTGKIGVGSGNTTPTAMVDISGITGYNQLRVRTSYTPSSSGDTNGNVGDIAWDNNYVYVKTNTGWGRSTLDYGF